MRVLDLGCGAGRDLRGWRIDAADRVTGLDIDHSRLCAAKDRFADRNFVHAVGERLPFKDRCFDRIISSVALPYMDIPITLAELNRVLQPRGTLSLSLHLPQFTFSELVHNAFPKPIPMLFRLYVIANGVWFHCTGKTIGLPNRRTESFQTERGMRLALQRAGFEYVASRHGRGPTGATFTLEARKAAAMTVRAAAA